MYKYIGLALLGVFAMMVIPAAQVESGSTGPEFYGIGSMVLYNAEGNEMFSQSMHNEVVDAGEDYIITQVFQDAATVDADATGISTICLSAESGFVDTLETRTAANFDSTDGLSESNCIEDSTISYTPGGGTVTIGPLTFASDGTNVANGDTIQGIGICQGHTSTPFIDCATADGATGILFAQVNVANTQLLTGETVQISYTFNIA